MALQVLDFRNIANQRINTTVEIDNKLVELEIYLRFNRMAGYWFADITDKSKKEVVLASMPILPYQNMLEQYQYLKIGSTAVIGISNLSFDDLTYEYFSSDFKWYWGNSI